MLSRGARLLHDNAPVHTAAVGKAAVKKCGFQEIEHPPYSPDPAPSDYYLFSKLKKNLRGRKFDDDEVKSAVMEHFADKDPEYFLKRIEMLVHRCEKCVEVKGDYIANSKAVSFLSPFKVRQARNLWTLPRNMRDSILSTASV